MQCRIEWVKSILYSRCVNVNKIQIPQAVLIITSPPCGSLATSTLISLYGKGKLILIQFYADASRLCVQKRIELWAAIMWH